MNIAIFGTGYVGLVSGVSLADSGKNVHCIDIDEEKIAQINDGIAPIYEPGLSELLVKNKARVHPTTDAKSAILDSEVVFIAVGTPFDGEEIDLSYIKQAATEIGEALKDKSPYDYTVVVVKSTVVPGTTEDVVKKIVLEVSGKTENEIGFCMNPEFLREGNAVNDFKNPDRIVLGVNSEKAEEIMRRVYDAFPETDIVITNLTTAEMIKYTANSYLALTISYANEIARITETLDNVDSEDVFQGVMLDKRISPINGGNRIVPKLTTYMRAGVGFGGSCFPKDVKALESFARGRNVDGHLLNGLLEINASQILHTYRRGLNQHPGEVKKVAILGTAFKPETDDIRESPGVKIANLALEDDLEVNVHDFIALDNTRKKFRNSVQYFNDPMAAINDADVIYVTTIWPEYLNISDQDFREHMKEDAIMVDCRSLYKKRKDQPWRIRVGLNTATDNSFKVEKQAVGYSVK